MAWGFISTAGYFIRDHRVSDTDSVVQKHKKYYRGPIHSKKLRFMVNVDRVYVLTSTILIQDYNLNFGTV
jgi:hypothetical protein